MPYETAGSVVSTVGRLSSSWSQRHSLVSKWYRLIRLENDLAKPHMESVISNDPRTSFDLALWLLRPKVPKFEFSRQGLSPTQAQQMTRLEGYSLEQYHRWDELSRSELFGSQVTRLLSFMLCTGWYALACEPGMDGSWSLHTMNPLTLYPEYDEGGCLRRLGRSYTIGPEEARAKLAANPGWVAPVGSFSRGVTVRTIWQQEGMNAWFVLAMNNQIVVPYQPTPFMRIPIYTGPVVGLPDDGTLSGVNWKGEVAQSIVTALADVQKNFDRMLTYMQQLLRDTAEPRILEKLRGQSVVTADTWYSRGAVYTIEPGESIETVSPPIMPPELRAHEFDLRNMIQRATFSDTTFGSVSGQMSSILMSQIIAAAQRVLWPFQDTFQWLMGQAALFNLTHMEQMGVGLDGGEGFTLPLNTRASLKYDVTIPGDFIQRASTARVLNPEFRLSQQTLYEQLFPEVQNPTLEEGRLNAEDAANHPIFKTLMTVVELHRAAQEARTAQQGRLAEQLQKAAVRLEGELFVQQAGGGAGSTPQGGLPTGGIPPVFQELLSGR